MKTTEDLMIVDTGTANLASISAAFRRLGARPRLVRDPKQVENATHLVLPGVGSFGPAMAGLRATGMDRALLARIRSERPLLAICLGMQLLLEGSEESPGCPGLGILPGIATTYGHSVSSPQFGWNDVDPDPECRFLGKGHCYFANSYKLDTAPRGWARAWAQHGARFVAGVERPGLLACQFHPELSGEVGHRILDKWLHTIEEEQVTC